MSKDIKEKILKLKNKKNAVILAHNYQKGEVQDIADYVGDSLELSMIAAKTDAKIIVFCGVHFMAETAKILSPNKKVLLPEIEAGCPMADMISADDVINEKIKHPQATVVCYVNTTASVKAHCDYCVTSANAEKIVAKLAKPEIIFLPDKYLGSYVEQKTGKKMFLMNGYCPTHLRITVEDLEQASGEHPNSIIIAHPECSQEVVKRADIATSTSGMCRFIKESKSTEFIIATELGIIHRLKKENPDKIFWPATERAVCENMKKINLEKILWALEDEKFEITLDDETRNKAELSVKRMLELV